MMYKLVAFITGLLLSAGLGYSGMTQPEKVYNFFNIFGDWDPSMMFVIVGAIGTHMILFHLIMKKESPLFASKFMVPGQGKVDVKLIGGAVLFGTGWAITGFCPAPAVTAVVSGHESVLIYLVSMTTGIFIADSLKK